MCSGQTTSVETHSIILCKAFANICALQFLVHFIHVFPQIAQRLGTGLLLRLAILRFIIIIIIIAILFIILKVIRV